MEEWVCSWNAGLDTFLFLGVAFTFNMQVAGSAVGEKGNEHNNLIITLTPTIKISLKRAFDAITEKFLECANGFEAYDCYSGQVEKVSFHSQNFCWGLKC